MLISVITAAYNAAPTLDDCLRTVAMQDADVQHILVDGASTDGTAAIIKTHQSALAQVVSEPDQGVYDGMNKGIGLATGDVVGILNADDFYPTPAVLDRVVQAFTDPEVGACYGDLLYVDREDTGRVVRRWRAGEFTEEKFYNGWMPPHPTFFVRRQLYEEYGTYRLDLGSAADYELMLRFLLRHRMRAMYIPEVLVHMRTGGASNRSMAARWRANRNDALAWKLNGLRPRPWTVLAKPLRKIGQWWV